MERTIILKNVPPEIWKGFFDAGREVSRQENSLLPILESDTMIIDVDSVYCNGDEAIDIFSDMMSGAVTLAALTVTDKYLNP